MEEKTERREENMKKDKEIKEEEIRAGRRRR
jgi:hypothetical protein